MNFCTLCIPEVLLNLNKSLSCSFIACIIVFQVCGVLSSIFMVISLAFMLSYLKIFQLESLIAIKVIIG